MKIEEIIDDSSYQADLDKTTSIAKELNKHVLKEELHPEKLLEMEERLKEIMPMKYFKPGTIGSFIYGCFNERYDPHLECAVSPFHETYEHNKLYLINGLQYALVQNDKVSMYVVKEPTEKELILAGSLVSNPPNEMDLFDFYSRRYLKTVKVPTCSAKTKNNKYYIQFIVFGIILIALIAGGFFLMKKYRSFGTQRRQTLCEDF
ncbi:hypothetical protein GAYE_PCTG36G0946 [Galdieria yellowstonensis]|uniref:Uncharacterized protein n=1 Tax=Galdieria yellowstonensis TaxID=3028027 RepID=A0AAV9I7F8_9RHOD|nr:hypothetical protein GAYE_PCTG36G0946 [Galdieria yellowstonensis]